MVILSMGVARVREPARAGGIHSRCCLSEGCDRGMITEQVALMVSAASTRGVARV